MKKEEWKYLPDYKGVYEISNHGRVRLAADAPYTPRYRYQPLDIIKLVTHQGEYSSPCLYPVLSVPLSLTPDHIKQTRVTRHKITVHRVVAELFIVNPDGYELVKHIDGDYSNNYVENLQWVKRSEIALNGDNRPIDLSFSKDGKRHEVGDTINRWEIKILDSVIKDRKKVHNRTASVLLKMQCLKCSTTFEDYKVNLITKIHSPCPNCGYRRRKYTKKQGSSKITETNKLYDVPKIYLRRVRVGAKKRNLECPLSDEYITGTFYKGIQCALTGKELFFTINQGGTTASLDRIDSSKGYTKDNIQWIHKDINRMKGALKEDIFKEYCKLVAANN